MLTIGKIAELSGLSADAIRYYEKEDLIAPTQKSDAGYRMGQAIDTYKSLSELFKNMK